MKICIFSKPFHPAIGGLEQIAKTLAFEFAYAQCDVEVVTNMKAPLHEDNRFPFIITRTSKFKDRYAAFKRSDVVLFMNFTFSGVPIAILANRPIVLSHHGIYNSRVNLKTKLLEFSKRQLSRFFSNIAVSDFVAKYLPGKSIVVPNAYDECLFQYIELTRKRDFIFCGRLVSDKGVNILIDAFKTLSEIHGDATLTIVGDGPELKALQDQAKLFIAGDNIEFSGMLNHDQHLADKLRQHSCMVIPSLWEEPFGIVALEGIASCDTIICSNRGGLPEALGECGVLVDPTVVQLANAMISVIDAQKIGSPLPGQPTPRQRALHLSKHAPNHVAQEYLRILHKNLRE